MKNLIGIIDYKAGNAPSVLNALNKIGIKTRLLTTPAEADDVAAVILPGVGSARATIDSLAESGWTQYLDENVKNKDMPFLGICVGLQVLFDYSEEGNTQCLSFLAGQVRRFSDDLVRVPQMGWNKTQFTNTHPCFKGLNSPDYFYFVNSYYVMPADQNIIAARTDYGISFCSAVAHNNIAAVQFHAEKSGDAGLKLLKNFAAFAGV